MEKMVLCIGRVDTKGEITRYLKDRIEQQGVKCLVMDIGISVEPYFPPDITREEVARAAGRTFQDIIALQAEGPQMAAMAEGGKKIARDLYAAGKLHGIVSLGGGMTTDAATAVMRELPVGVPKLMVSSKVAQIGGASYMGNKDVTMMPSVIDISSVNTFSRRIIDNAAYAIVGMIHAPEVKKSDKPTIGMTRLGDTTPCEENICRILGDKYEVVVFHSIGPGGRALEDFIATSPVDAVIEVGLNEIGNHIFGGRADAGADRLEAAGKKGIIQMITLGAVDFINLGSPEVVPDKYKKRTLNYHNPQATTMRLNADEMTLVAKTMADKLNQATGPVEVIIPTKGFSELNRPSKLFYDPESDKVFIDTLTNQLKKSIIVRRVDAHINDPQFAAAVVEDFEKLRAKKL